MSTICEKKFRQRAEISLGLCLYDDAIFFAERLHSEHPHPDNLNLLAQIYFRKGKMKQTYLILQQSTTPSNRYLLAQACIQLRKYNEAEMALTSNQSLDPKAMTIDSALEVPGQAAGLYLLGIACKQQHRRDAAIEYFKQSLKVRIICCQWHPIFLVINFSL